MIPAAEMQRFDEETAFERYAITAYSLDIGDKDRGSASIDLRDPDGHAHVAIHVIENLSSGAVAGAISKYLPLVFGAAYKIIDLLVEMMMRVASPATATGHLSFAKKLATAPSLSPPPPLDQAPALWAAVVELYRNFEHLRHSLVHRTATIDAASGTLTGYDEVGAALRPATKQEQEAFARLALGVAKAVIGPATTPHELRTFGWWANRLNAHHGQSRFPEADAAQPMPTVIAELEQRADGTLFLDRDALLARARAVFQTAVAFVGELHGGGRRFRCVLDDIPVPSATFAPNNPPVWLDADT